MGGSGGKGYFSSDPRRLRSELSESQEESARLEFEARCNEELQNQLGAFNDRDSEAISNRLEEIKAAISDELEEEVVLRFGGSVSKHTFVDGLSDVDALVLLNKTELEELAPEEARHHFAERLRQWFSSREASVEEGTLAVTVHFKDVDIQLLPALRTRSGVKIADSTGSSWAQIQPTVFSRALTEVNATNGGKVVPVIKLAKGIVGNLTEGQRLSGYHTEALAVEAFREYKGRQTLKDMLNHLFTFSSERVLSPIRDKTGQSYHVDEYLGPSGSLERKIVADRLDRIARRLRNAETAQSVSQIRLLFEE